MGASLDPVRDLIESGPLAHLVTVNPPMPDPPPGYITRIRVDRIAGQGPWVA